MITRWTFIAIVMYWVEMGVFSVALDMINNRKSNNQSQKKAFLMGPIPIIQAIIDLLRER